MWFQDPPCLVALREVVDYIWRVMPSRLGSLPSFEVDLVSWVEIWRSAHGQWAQLVKSLSRLATTQALVESMGKWHTLFLSFTSHYQSTSLLFTENIVSVHAAVVCALFITHQKLVKNAVGCNFRERWRRQRASRQRFLGSLESRPWPSHPSFHGPQNWQFETK